MTDAPRSALDPVFLGLRIGLHALVVGLTVVVIATAPATGFPNAVIVVCVAAAFLGTYGVGALAGHTSWGGARRDPALWVAILSLEWLVLTVLSPEAMYLVFPLSFLYLHFLAEWRGPVAVAVSTGIAIASFGALRGFSLAGIIGPVIGAAVALAIGLGYRSLDREATERERLIAELTVTRTQLAASERAAGILDERGRLAREIHDTVSQSLSSIVMLLHAADRSVGDPAVSKQRMLQARDAASEALAETRQFINELAPPSLRTATIVDALQRLAANVRSTTTTDVSVTVAGPICTLPTPIETALLRVAQSALANVIQHAQATRADITLSLLDNEVILDVVDNGIGFDTAQTPRPASADNTSFGLQAMRERTRQLGGTLVVESTPGQGTNIVASFEADE